MLPKPKRIDEAQLPLNNRIELWQLKLSDEEDETGSKIDKDTFLKKLWANIKVIRGMESLENGKKVPYQFYKIKIRYNKHIETSMYFKYQGKILDIVSIDNLDERDLYMDIECRERMKPSG